MSTEPIETETLDDLAELVRAKNAGPFWITLDVFLASDADFDRVCASPVVDPAVVASLYRTEIEQVRVFPMRELRAIKISFPRPTVQGSFADRDMHSGQQHVPLAQLVVPALG